MIKIKFLMLIIATLLMFPSHLFAETNTNKINVCVNFTGSDTVGILMHHHLLKAINNSPKFKYVEIFCIYTIHLVSIDTGIIDTGYTSAISIAYSNSIDTLIELMMLHYGRNNVELGAIKILNKLDSLDRLYK